eukprot:TRINITY_DN6644_c0_g1_i1.p1 TRINITY_DN6644_c0_g1~~TRINITY_DN6644_c0_g1_i1.p1  ORF type:complete len:358 (-),score=30.48 TRINITY_DN6644_c0_g1_i1:668-1741(-)
MGWLRREIALIFVLICVVAINLIAYYNQTTYKNLKKDPLTKKRIAFVITGQIGRLRELHTKLEYIVYPILEYNYGVDLIFKLDLGPPLYVNGKYSYTEGEFSTFIDIKNYFERNANHPDIRLYFDSYNRNHVFMRNEEKILAYDKTHKGKKFLENRFQLHMSLYMMLRESYEYIMHLEKLNGLDYELVFRIREDLEFLGPVNLRKILKNIRKKTTRFGVNQHKDDMKKYDYISLKCYSYGGVNDKIAFMNRGTAEVYFSKLFESMYVDYPQEQSIPNPENYLRHVLDSHGFRGGKFNFDDIPVLVVRNRIEGHCFHGSKSCPKSNSKYYQMYTEGWCLNYCNKSDLGNTVIRSTIVG